MSRLSIELTKTETCTLAGVPGDEFTAGASDGEDSAAWTEDIRKRKAIPKNSRLPAIFRELNHITGFSL
jgi:hypothetical protein